MAGTGGACSADLALLNAFRRDANDDFFVNGEVLTVVPTDDCAEWANGALNLRVE